MKPIFTLFLGVVTLIACQTHSTETQQKGEAKTPVTNIFHDKTLQKIYTLQNQRDSKGLFPYLKEKNPVFRKAAILAFASVQDAAAIEPLFAPFEDTDEGIRAAAAYAIGQIKDKAAEPILITTYEKEKSPAVKQNILEAIGKCGTMDGLAFITNLKIEKEETLLFIGQAWALYRFALQNIVSEQGSARAIELISPDIPEKARFIAANYLARAREIDLKKYYVQLLHAFETEKNLFTRMNLISAMGKALHPEVLKRLKTFLKADLDYRMKVNAIGALRGFEYNQIRETIFDQLGDTNVNISIAAAEFLLANGTNTDAETYFETALTLSLWRGRATLLTASLRYADKDNKALKKKISNAIIDIYKKSQNNYEKANLLTALAGDPANYSFLEDQAFFHIGSVIGTNAMDALVTMSRSAKENDKMITQFARIFQKAVGSRDSAVVTLAAGILREPEMNFKERFKDTEFLTTALNNCKLPEDLEARLELQKTINFFSGTKTTEDSLPVKNAPIDWELVAAIEPDQRVTIKTEKGNIIIQLMVNQSPGSVSNFIRLIKENFYKNSFIHRVVPNFVIQDGCPRGDGWGSPPFTIGSELGPLYYEEGSVGMASAGKDTEGSQWFITHSPTPHLDGRYTIFGKVVFGMDVVHKLEVGDKILDFEL
jgi:cyclophilin family peptidyl-prolyl cis-trans isomerase